MWEVPSNELRAQTEQKRKKEEAQAVMLCLCISHGHHELSNFAPPYLSTMVFYLTVG
jgi:hypothetical protein